MWVLVILLYLFGCVPTYCLFNETTKQPVFNKVWFAIFWPAVALMKLVTLFKKV